MDAAEPGELIGLMSEDGAPWCYSEDATTLRCSTLADRTTRSGIYELEEWMRLDRPYCGNEIFRSIVLDNATMTEAECRLTIYERYHNCQVQTCPRCISPCNYPWAKSVADVLKCFRGDTHMGFVHYYMVSDAGIYLGFEPENAHTPALPHSHTLMCLKTSPASKNVCVRRPARQVDARRQAQRELHCGTRPLSPPTHILYKRPFPSYAQSASAGTGEARFSPLLHGAQQPHRPAATRLHRLSQRTSQLADAAPHRRV